jgi:hypothetical protein
MSQYAMCSEGKHNMLGLTLHAACAAGDTHSIKPTRGMTVPFRRIRSGTHCPPAGFDGSKPDAFNAAVSAAASETLAATAIRRTTGTQAASAAALSCSIAAVSTSK